MKTLPLTEAKNRFSRVIDAVADRDERVMITRNGKPAAILINPERLNSLIATLDILSDPNMMAQIRQSERDFAAGRYKDYTLDELDELFGEP
ncbi:MAG: type II toxin-antitoxin system Phd/YefM family antitoxin [Chloroflexi bacterium]|nr:type II toxin-antitoxin system Phd/YefM family antitoxin [Chloroflexota bacterium]